MDQIKAVVPLALYLILFQVLVLRQPIDAAASLAVGLAAVIVGLAVFMEGLSTGLMPFGKIIGDNLPKKASMTVVYIIIGYSVSVLPLQNQQLARSRLLELRWT